MTERIITTERIAGFSLYLHHEERSSGTIEKYLRDIRALCAWLGGAEVTKDALANWKAHLQEAAYKPVTVNSMLASLNSFLCFAGWEDCKVKYLRIQRQLFREPSKELTREEYNRLISTAQEEGKERLALLMETICATGIRVSEVRYITVEAALSNKMQVSLKGKIRTILLPGKLSRKLLKYARKHKTASGEIFLTKSGKSLNRRQIWAEMKRVCKKANVSPSKVFPHNLRHLFARVFYSVCRDVAKLADVLGHSSIETTRIYLISTGEEHARQLDRLNLVS